MTQTSSYKRLHLYTEVVSGNLFRYLILHYTKKPKTLTHCSQIAGRVGAAPHYPPVLIPLLPRVTMGPGYLAPYQPIYLLT
jgi:hypothetical protein